MTCAEYLVDFLIRTGVRDVFGYAGGYIVPFMDALARRPGEICVHVCHHEQACALAACGYARLSGGLGVYFTTSGPGAVNALGGLADAWFDSVALLGICGNVPTAEYRGYSGIRQLGFQELDLLSMVRPICKYCVTPAQPQAFADIVARAHNLALSGRRGGVVLDFPFDMQTAAAAGR